MFELEQAVRAGMETLSLVHFLAEIEERHRLDGEDDAALSSVMGQARNEALRVSRTSEDQILEMLYDLQVYGVDLESSVYRVTGNCAWYNWKTRMRLEILRNQFESMRKSLTDLSSSLTALLLSSQQIERFADMFQISVDLKWALCKMMSDDASVREVLETMRVMAANNIKRLVMATTFPDYKHESI